MVSILPSDRSGLDILGRYLGQSLSQSLPQAIQRGSDIAMQQKKNMAIQQQFGPEIANLPPELQKLYVADQLKDQRSQKVWDMINKAVGINPQIEQNEAMEGQTVPGQLNAQNFDPAQISDEALAQIAAVDPQTANLLQRQKDVALREKSRAQELAMKERKMDPEFQREQRLEASQAQADVKFNQQLQEASKQHELKKQTLERLEALNEKGVTGKPYEKLLERAGLVNLTSEGRREFAADVKNLITDIRSILGAQFTGFEFQTILNAYPSADFSKDANKAIIRNLQEFQDIKSKEVEIAQQLKKENGGKIPFDFQSKVNEEVRKYAASKANDIKKNTREIMREQYKTPKNSGFTLMFDQKGEPIEVPDSEVEEAKKFGATL
jgi:hypothetical protein